MGFFSFGKKDDAPRRRGAAAKPTRGGAAFEGRETRRSRRSERAGDADAMLLDPTLPEKQRARRRLVGAIALVLAAIVILPMVLDSHPKPVTDDIAIDIPNRPATVPARAGDDSDADAQAAVAPDRADPSDAEAGSSAAAAGIASAPAPATATQSKATHTESKPAPAKQAPSGASSAPAARPSTAQSSKPAAVASPSPAEADSGTPAAPPGARFAVQLGVFADDASARAWETKLKAAGVPAYIEHRKQADGKTRALLRAGPFADRAAASAAIAKVRDAGLTANAANAGQ
ncbi:SPOR domain-containing protein [Trinickia dabaoshanensis]|uniref:SPOR domain-containing protein n=1 Tax=Trinickia dabaoshanensis TaxID=564714 RepID=A0A2N7VGB9_9BURK|nr:SPOR domain-containing protein [Trinickia dabaoshanensis]PMS16192.1 SPOR domain-containing protein [Trinickia dabaoshanensis]